MPKNLIIPIQHISQGPGQGVVLGDNIYESVSMSLFNALNGDPDGAFRSLLASKTLAPSQRQRLIQDHSGKRGGFMEGVLNTITNPLVIVGLALSMKYPLLNPAGAKAIAANAVKYGKWIPSPLRGLLGLNEIFHGTKIPRLFQRITRESATFMEKHFASFLPGAKDESILRWRAAAGRVETTKDQIRWTMQMDPWWKTKKGLEPINKQLAMLNKRRIAGGEAPLRRLTPDQFNVPAEPFDHLITEPARKAFLSVRQDLQRDPQRLRVLTAHLQRQGIPAHETVRWIKEGFFPRVGITDRGAVNAIKQAYFKKVLGDPELMTRSPAEIARRMTVERAKGVSTGRLALPTGTLVPDASDLQLLEGAVDSRALNALAEIKASRAFAGDVPAYTLRFSSAVRGYGNSVGRAHAWSYVRETPGGSTSLGEALIRETQLVHKAETAAGKGLAKTELLKSNYIPMALGHGSFEANMRALEWGGVRQAAHRIVQSPQFKKWVPKDVGDKLAEMIQSDSGAWSLKGAGNKIASYFYLTTLGMNLGSATQNLLQPILTTGPMIGMEATAKGMASVASKIPRYARLRAGGMAEREALRKLWPQFAERSMDSTPLFSEAVGQSAELASSSLLRPAGRKVLEQGKAALMAPFRNTELFNRLSTFEGGLIRARTAGLTDATQVADFAQEVTNISQLWAGFQSTPSMMLNWWAPFRQFMTFPAKLGGFAAASVMKMGGPFNPGTLGRAMAYSTAAYEMTRATTGADISQSLLYGALPLPEEGNRPFAPIPITPPVISIAGALAMDVFGGGGDFEQTRRSIPLLVPGGMQLARVLQTRIPAVGKALGRNYADWDQRTPDGRIPVFTPNGQLIGYRSAWSLTMDSLGVPGKLLKDGTENDERAVLQLYLGNRDRMREMRRQYIEATLDLDMVKAEAVANEYLRLYGGPMQVRPQDFEAAKTRRFLPRIDKVLQSIPRDARPAFGVVAATALSGLQGRQFLGLDPGLLGIGLTRERVQLAEQQNQPAEDPFALAG